MTVIGSYAPDDVTLLLTELPDAGLELPADVRAAAAA